MDDQPKNPNPATEADLPPKQTFFVVEIRGGCQDLHSGACTVMELGIESAMALVNTNLGNRHKRPKILLHRPGTFDLTKVQA